MQAVVRKWGNSAAIRLPAALLKALHLRIDQTVTLHEEDGQLIIKPAPAEEPSLNRLVSAITDANRHDEVDFGSNKGGEHW